MGEAATIAYIASLDRSDINMNTPVSPSSEKKKPDFLLNLLCNVIIPVVIMSYASSEDRLGPAWSITLALAFPLIYGVVDLRRSGHVNMFSVLGIVSVLLTGGISLLKLPAEYIAIKEAAIPALIGLAVVISQYRGKPLVKVIILNDELIDWQKLNHTLNAKNLTEVFNEKLEVTTFIVAGSFFMSAVLNYVLAKMVLISEPGTTAYTEELAKMTALSYPVIVIPSMIMLFAAVFYILRQITKLTGQELDEFINV